MDLQIGVKVLIQNLEAQFLFIKRQQVMESETSTSWDIPGGRIHPDEALLEGLSREVSEETGINGLNQVELIDAQDIFVESKNKHVVRLTYTATMEVGTIRLSDEHQDFKWVSATQLSAVDVEPYLRQTLAKFMKSQ